MRLRARTASIEIRTRSTVVVALLGLLFCFAHGRSAEAACGGSPAVATDKPDYGPQETVAISGSGFNCGDSLFVLVTAPDGSTFSGDGAGSSGPDSVLTDENGAFSLSYRLSGTLTAGGTYQGQLGIYRIDVLDSSNAVIASASFGDSSGYFSCVVTTSGGAKCWGTNWSGQLGDGTTNWSATPVDVSGLTSGVAQITMGYDHACALLTTGGIKCWGANYSGQLGTGTTFQSYVPVDVSGLTSGVAQVSAGFYHTCALMTNGGVKCWGQGGNGALGNGTFGGALMPVNVSGLSGVVQISGGYNHHCALTAAGGVKCWGYNSYGEVGNGTFTSGVGVPVDVNGLTSGVAQISAGGLHTCAVTISGGAKCWGYNYEGALGTGTHTLSSPYGIATPVDVVGLTTGVAQLTAGYTSCALTTSGGVKCWGSNYYGSLGNGTMHQSPPYGIPTPVDVNGLTSGVAQVRATTYHACALTVSGVTKCWGFNYYGQVGNGIFSPFPYAVSTPVNVIGLTSGVASLWDGEGGVLDSIAPSAAPSHSPAANGANWNNSDVIVSWNWTDDGGSGIDAANCTTSSTTSAEGNLLTLNATCKDLSGNEGTASYTVMVDKTRPTISAAATTSANANGWYNSNVTVAFTCADTLSGIPACPANETLSAEAAAVSSSAATVTDNADNVSVPSNVVTVKIDKTAPAVSLSGGVIDGHNYYFGSVPPTPNCVASDGLSGLDGACVIIGFSTAVGPHTVVAIAKDRAGNQSSASLNYTVLAWTLSGFYQPIDMNGVWNIAKNGSTVPLKFEVFAGAAELTDIGVVAQPITATQTPCAGGPTDEIEILATGATALRYDATAGQFIYNWQTPKKAGFCYVVTVTLTDGTSTSANVRLK